MAGLRTLIRGLGILSILLTLVAVALTVTLLYTAALISSNMMFGEPSFEVAGSKVDLEIPITLTNKGMFAISSFGLTIKTAALDGSSLGEGTSGPVSIAAGQSTTILHKINIDFANLSPQTLNQMLTEDGSLSFGVDVSANIAPFIETDLSSAGTMPWGAPMKDLALGEPSVEGQVNQTHVTLSIPIGFRNNSPFLDFTGLVQIDLFDASGGFVGSGSIPLNVQPNTNFDDMIRVTVSIASISLTPFTAVLKIQTTIGEVQKEINLDVKQ